MADLWGADKEIAKTVLPVLQPEDILRYRFSSDDQDLITEIQKFHRKRDGKAYRPEQIFPSSGSSNLVSAFMQFLKRKGIKKVYYFPPLYYLFYDQAQLLGIDLVPLSRKPISMIENLKEVLPKSQNVKKDGFILLSDPIWMMGVPVPENNIETLRQWQEKTGGNIFVDGTFQYIKWNPNVPEFSSRLHENSTFRLVCPSKQIGIHGVRFAYLLLPNNPDVRALLRLSASNLGGGHSAFDRLAAPRVMQALTLEKNKPFIESISSRYRALKNSGLILEEGQTPSSTIFLFAKVRNIENYTAMDQEFFGLEDFPDFVRVNIFSDAFDSFLK